MPDVKMCLDCPAADVFVAKSSAILTILRSHHVLPSLQAQFLAQIFRIFSCHVANALLQDQASSRLCTMYGGMGLKVSLSSIESWMDEESKTSNIFTEVVTDELAPVRDICNVLLLGKGIRTRAVKGLNYAQLQRLADYYNSNIPISDLDKKRITKPDLDPVRLNRASTSKLRDGSEQLYQDPKTIRPFDYKLEVGRFALSTVPLPEGVAAALCGRKQADADYGTEMFRFLSKEADNDEKQLVL
jgi:hypothetical protein